MRPTKTVQQPVEQLSHTIIPEAASGPKGWCLLGSVEAGTLRSSRRPAGRWKTILGPLCGHLCGHWGV